MVRGFEEKVKKYEVSEKTLKELEAKLIEAKAQGTQKPSRFKQDVVQRYLEEKVKLQEIFEEIVLGWPERHDVGEFTGRFWYAGVYEGIELYRKLKLGPENEKYLKPEEQKNQKKSMEKRRIEEELLLERQINLGVGFFNRMIRNIDTRIEGRKYYEPNLYLLKGSEGNDAILGLVKLLSICYIFLGDLERYRVRYLALNQPKGEDLWAIAKQMYINAIKSYRYNGRGYSQLAIVSTYERDNEMAIYWNCFGVCMQEKRENADKNLSIMAKNYVNTVSVNTCKMRMQHIFLASCFGYLLVNNELPIEQGKDIKKMFENAHSMCESDRRDNVGNGTKYGRYDEFVIAVVVVTMLNETIQKIAIEKDQNQSHQDSYAKVSVMQEMVKLVLGHLKTLFAQMNKEFRAKTEAVLDIQKWSMAAAGLYIDYICYLVDNRLEVIRGDPVSYKCLFPGVQNIIKKFKDNQNQQKVEKTSVIQRDKDGEVSGAVLQPCYHDHLVLGFQFFEQLHSSIILSPLPNDDNNSSNLVDGFIHRSTYALQKLSHCK